jgi:hypothetical protein
MGSRILGYEDYNFFVFTNIFLKLLLHSCCISGIRDLLMQLKHCQIQSTCGISTVGGKADASEKTMSQTFNFSMPMVSLKGTVQKKTNWD